MKRISLSMAAVSGVLLGALACGGSQRPAPQSSAGVYFWKASDAKLEGTLWVHSGADPAGRDTLKTIAGDVIECGATIASCSMVCGPFCFQVHDGRLEGTFVTCAMRPGSACERGTVEVKKLSAR